MKKTKLKKEKYIKVKRKIYLTASKKKIFKSNKENVKDILCSSVSTKIFFDLFYDDF